MLYDDRILRALADAERDGYTGDALTKRVYETMGVSVDAISKREREALEDAFVKHVHKAAKRTAAKASDTRQARLIV